MMDAKQGCRIGENKIERRQKWAQHYPLVHSTTLLHPNSTEAISGLGDKTLKLKIEN
jgi:hypothetical protein